MKTFFTIALSGLSEADVKQVLATLESPGLDKWSLSEGGNSDVVIIDVDSVWGHMDWLRAVAEDRRCVAYTEQDSMRDCDLLLRKPLDTAKLAAMLKQLQSGKPAAAGASEASAPAPRPSAAPAVQRQEPPAPPAGPPAPSKAKQPDRASPAAHPAPAPAKAARAADASRTVGSLLLTGEISGIVLIEGQGDTRLVIDPASNSYHAPPQLKSIEKLLDLPADRISPLEAGSAEAQHAGPKQPIIRLLWFAALCASDGKLAPHLDPNAVWHLTRWPQIEREFPRHFRIATAMMKQAGTLEDVAEAAKSPVGDVASFINAYYVAGYVAAEGSEEPAETAANSTANVLSRLRRTFSRGARESA